MTIEEQIAEVITKAIYHGRHFSPSRDEIVVKKDVEYILTLFKPEESRLRVITTTTFIENKPVDQTTRPLTPIETNWLCEKLARMVRAEALAIPSGRVTLDEECWHEERRNTYICGKCKKVVYMPNAIQDGRNKRAAPIRAIIKKGGLMKAFFAALLILVAVTAGAEPKDGTAIYDTEGRRVYMWPLQRAPVKYCLCPDRGSPHHHRHCM